MGLIKFLSNIFKKKKEENTVENLDSSNEVSDSAKKETVVIETKETEYEPLTLSDSNKLIAKKISNKRKSLQKAIENSRNFHNLLDDRIQDEQNERITRLFENENNKQITKLKNYNDQLSVSDKDACQGLVDKASIAHLDEFISLAKSLKKSIKAGINPTVKKFVGKIDISIVSPEFVKANIKNKLVETQSNPYNEFVEEVEQSSEKTEGTQISFLNE